MQLKNYQDRVLKEIEQFYETAFEKRKESLKATEGLKAVGGDYSDNNYVEKAFAAHSLPYNDRCKNGLGEYYPRLTIKVPTGGGKTLLAVKAIQKYQQVFAQRRTGLVVWVVPSETIYNQTIEALRDKSHPYRQMLDQVSGNRTVIEEKQGGLSKSDLDDNLVVMFAMIQSLNRRNSKARLKFFADRGGLDDFFPTEQRYDLHEQLIGNFPNLDTLKDRGYSQNQVLTSLVNAIRISQPFIIIDEIHKVFSDQARETIDNLNPEMIIGLSATPKKGMNILSEVSGKELLDEEMIKMPMHIIPPNSPKSDDWQNMLKNIHEKREKLAKSARNCRDYIRPIALIQVEHTGKTTRDKDSVHSEDAKQFLMRELGIPEERIAIKSSSQNDLQDVDLLSDNSSIEWIITKDALKEGWDCPFAYILGIIPNSKSERSVTQLIGRVLRQPYTTKTQIPELDESYVYFCKGEVIDVVNKVRKGLETEGYGDLTSSQILNDSDNNQNTKNRVSDAHREKPDLPVWYVVDDKQQPTHRFSYEKDILPHLDFDNFLLNKSLISNIKNRIDEGNATRMAFKITASEKSVGSIESECHAIDSEKIDINYSTRLLSEVIGNPFKTRKLTEKWVSAFKEELDHKYVANHFTQLIMELQMQLVEYKRKQEESIFLGKVERKEIISTSHEYH